MNSEKRLIFAQIADIHIGGANSSHAAVNLRWALAIFFIDLFL